MTIDQTSLEIATRRRRQLRVALVVAGIALLLAVVALIGSARPAIWAVLGTLVTVGLLVLELHSWRQAVGIWTGATHSATLRPLVLRTVIPSLPVLLLSAIIVILVGVQPFGRLVHGPPGLDERRWTDGPLGVALVLYLGASAAAAVFPVRVKR